MDVYVRTTRRCLALLLAALAFGFACLGQGLAATVYRCGTVYQDRPCSEGAPQAQLATPPAPTEQERAEAERRAQAEANQARRMVAERQTRERAAAAAAQKTPTALSSPHPSTQEDDVLTRCTGTAKERRRWTERKREYCASQQLVQPSTRQRKHKS